MYAKSEKSLKPSRCPRTLKTVALSRSGGYEDATVNPQIAWGGTFSVLRERFHRKFYVFAAAIREQFYILAVIGILNSVVSLYYYMRPVKEMFLEQPVGEPAPVVAEYWNYGLMGVLALATIL
jgi:hypothetical protein